MPYEDEPAAYWLLMLRESLLEPVGSAFIARRFEERATS